MSHEYENTRRIVYGDEGATFVPVCEKCGRYVIADSLIRVGYNGWDNKENAWCSKCGRTKMIFEGFI